MKDEKEKHVNPNKLKAFTTNAISEIYKIETDAKLPIASDTNVEEARDWVNEGSQL